METDVNGVNFFDGELYINQDAGNIVFNDGECYGMRVLPKDGMALKAGSVYVVSNGINKWLLPPRPFSGYEALAEIGNEIKESDLMYWHDFKNGKVYLYSKEGNPGKRFNSVELCTKENAVQIYSDNILDNLSIKYTGGHGVGSGSPINVTLIKQYAPLK